MNNQIINILKSALATLEQLKREGQAPADFTPLSGHLATDKIIGCSRFSEEVKDIDDVFALITTTKRTEKSGQEKIDALANKLVEWGLGTEDVAAVKAALEEATGIELFDLWCPGVGMAIHTSVPVGKMAWTTPVDGETYIVKKSHGCLQPFGRCDEETAVMNVFTIALTLDDTQLGKKLAFASCYPGLPDNPDSDREGLVEGQELSAQEVRARKLHPKQPRG